MRPAFTLVELLVVLVILGILTAMVVSSITPDLDDKVSESSRIVQSYVNGARSHAISEGRPVGIRFVSSDADPRTVNELQYIEQPEHITGNGKLDYDMPTKTWTLENTVPGEWPRLNVGGRTLIESGNRIEIPRGSDNWYVIRGISSDTISLIGHYYPSEPVGLDYVAVPETVEYRMQLSMSVMPNKETASLPRGIVVDIDSSQWNGKDIVFNRYGSAGVGLIHLYITTVEDAELTRLRFPQHPANGGSMSPPIVPADPPTVPHTAPRVVTVISQSGIVESSEVNLADANGDFQADNPF